MKRLFVFRCLVQILEYLSQSVALSAELKTRMIPWDKIWICVTLEDRMIVTSVLFIVTLSLVKTAMPLVSERNLRCFPRRSANSALGKRIVNVIRGWLLASIGTR